jgi:hypothetical protein
MRNDELKEPLLNNDHPDYHIIDIKDSSETKLAGAELIRDRGLKNLILQSERYSAMLVDYSPNEISVFEKEYREFRILGKEKRASQLISLMGSAVLWGASFAAALFLLKPTQFMEYGKYASFLASLILRTSKVLGNFIKDHDTFDGAERFLLLKLGAEKFAIKQRDLIIRDFFASYNSGESGNMTPPLQLISEYIPYMK